jgi:dephospho-CoA kinase
MKIAICGPICSGKSFISTYLTEKYHLQRYAFGDKVKDIARELFKMNYKDRHLLQTISDKMKAIDPDVWIKYVIHQIEHMDNIIIDDLRFENETQYLQNIGFIIIKLTIDTKTQHERIRQTYPNTYQEHIDNLHHNSEQEHASIQADYIIQSDTPVLDTIDTILINYI